MRLVDFFFALRPLVLVPAWSFFILGWAAAGAVHPFPLIRAAALTLVLIGGHLVNQIVDFETDRMNGKGFFLQRGIFTRRTYAFATAACVVAGIGLAVAETQAAGRIAAAALLVVAYSTPPVRLAARPGFDVAANALGYGVLAPCIGAGRAALPAAVVASCAAVVAAVFLHTTLMDIDGDRRSGKRTIGVAVSAHWCRIVAAGLALAAVFVGRDDPPRIAATAAVALLCIAASVRLSSRAVVVGGTAAFALAAGWMQPLFALAVAILVAATRLYYSRRFALSYPAI
jgi:hypothetical protein